MSGITSAAFGQLRKRADKVAFDHDVTRKRVESLEQWATAFSREHTNVVSAFLNRPLLGRLRWLLLGR